MQKALHDSCICIACHTGHLVRGWTHKALHNSCIILHSTQDTHGRAMEDVEKGMETARVEKEMGEAGRVQEAEDMEAEERVRVE